MNLHAFLCTCHFASHSPFTVIYLRSHLYLIFSNLLLTVKLWWVFTRTAVVHSEDRKGKSAKMSTANYVGNFFTHQMKRVPRSVDQFPAKLKFKARMTRPRFGHKTVPTPQLVVLPQVDKMEKLRYPDGTTFPRFLEKEIQGTLSTFWYFFSVLFLSLCLSFSLSLSCSLSCSLAGRDGFFQRTTGLYQH